MSATVCTCDSFMHVNDRSDIVKVLLLAVQLSHLSNTCSTGLCDCSLAFVLVFLLQGLEHTLPFPTNLLVRVPFFSCGTLYTHISFQPLFPFFLPISHPSFPSFSSLSGFGSFLCPYTPPPALPLSPIYYASLAFKLTCNVKKKRDDSRKKN